jgi:hypothetical protein
MTRERYLEWRNSGKINEDFIYEVYLHSKPKKVLNKSELLVTLSIICENISYTSRHLVNISIESIVRDMIDFYNVYYSLYTLRDKKGNILRYF